MKKKLLCTVFALLMVLSFVACGGDEEKAAAGNSEKSDFDAFMEVQKNMADVKDMEFKMDMKMEVPDGDENLNVTMSGTGKEVIKAKDDIEMEMLFNMNMAGTDMKGTMYMKGQALYMEMMGQKMKMDASNEMGAMMNMDTENLFAITEEMISDLKVSKDGSDTTFKFKMDGNKAMDYFVKNAGSSSGINEASTEGVTFDKMDVTIVAGEDKMAKSIDMDFTVNTEIEGTTTTMNYVMTMDYLNINKNLKIDFPDFSDYQEIPV